LEGWLVGRVVSVFVAVAITVTITVAISIIPIVRLILSVAPLEDLKVADSALTAGAGSSG